MRWALKLSAFKYVVEHIPGEKNVWADMVTRWTVRSPRNASAKSLLLAPISPGLDSKLD